MKRFLFSLIVLPMTALLVGCPGGSNPNALPTYPVTGKVTQGGAPVAGATVTYSPVDNTKPAAFGRTDAQGVFLLSTYGSGDGAPEGEYKVLVSKTAPAGSGTGEVAHDPTGAGGSSPPPSHNARGGGQAAGGSLLPEKYSSAATTPLSKVVEKKDNEHNLEL